MLDLPPSKRREQARAEVLRVALLRWREPQADDLATLYLGDYAEDMQLLLQVASEDAHALAEALALSGAPAQDLVAAAVHYIEYCCLQPHGNPYRILGVRPDASADSIKQQYRMLIKLFHPDRALIAQARAEACAAAINQAYMRIRNGVTSQPDSAAASAGVAPRRAAAPSMPFSATPVALTPESTQFVPAAPANAVWYRQVPMQALLWGLAISAALVLAMLNLRSAPVELMAGAAPAVTGERQQAPHVPDAAASPTAAERLQESLLAYRASAASVPAVTVITPVPTESSPPVPAAVQPPRADAVRAPIAFARQAAAPSAPAPLPGVAAGAATAADAVPKPAQVDLQQPVMPAAAATMTEQAAKADAVLTEQHLRELILQFVDSYNQGDIERFTALMQPQLKGTEGNSQAELREAYSKVFANSTQREIVLKDLRWDIDGSAAVGEMDYKVTLRAHGSRGAESARGRLKLEVHLVEQTARIGTLINTPVKP